MKIEVFTWSFEVIYDHNSRFILWGMHFMGYFKKLFNTYEFIGAINRGLARETSHTERESAFKNPKMATSPHSWQFLDGYLLNQTYSNNALIIKIINVVIFWVFGRVVRVFENENEMPYRQMGYQILCRLSFGIFKHL